MLDRAGGKVEFVREVEYPAAPNGADRNDKLLPLSQADYLVRVVPDTIRLEDHLGHERWRRRGSFFGGGSALHPEKNASWDRFRR